MVSPCLHCTYTRYTHITCSLWKHDAGAHGSIGSMAPHAIDGGGIMTCRAKGTARAGTRTGGQARGRDKLDWLFPLVPSVPHNSSSCEIESKAPSHLHRRPCSRGALPRWPILPIYQPECCRCLCSRLIAVAVVLEQRRRIGSLCCRVSFRGSKEHRSS